MESETYERIIDRIKNMGLSDDAVEEKLAKYESIHENPDKHTSARDFIFITEDLMVDLQWLLFGKHDPNEVQMTVRNVLNGSDGTRGNKDWVEASEALRDPAMTYQQLALEELGIGASPKFIQTESKNVAYAMNALKGRAAYGSDLDFFGIIEEFFGVDVFVVDSKADFDAIGGMVCGSPFIVAKKGIDARTGHYAVARELGLILSGNLAWRYEVFLEDAPLDLWAMDFSIMLMDSYNGLAPIKGDPYGEQRFPQRVIEGHRKAVAERKNLGYFLEWMTGEKPPAVEHKPVDLDEMMELFGLNESK